MLAMKGRRIDFSHAIIYSWNFEIYTKRIAFWPLRNANLQTSWKWLIVERN